ncbi:MAG: ABC transporter permease [Burkholderiaceae bacterium]|nr:ABC transporter permease [Burkholderiaceae bacterium]
MKVESTMAVAWQHRALLLALIQRDLKNRYAGSLAGVAWGILHPLIMLAIYGLVFEHIFKVRVPQVVDNQPYVLFVATAMWPWLAFQEAVSRSVVAIQNNSAIVKKVSFPHELLVLSTVLASFFVQLVGYILVMVLLYLWGLGIHFQNWPAMLLAMLSLFFAALSVAFVLAALQVYVRDVEQLLSQVMNGLFYLSPILYTTATVPHWMGEVMQWNPLVHMLEPLRSALLNTSPADWLGQSLTLLACIFVFVATRIFFNRLAKYFEDML